MKKDYFAILVGILAGIAVALAIISLLLFCWTEFKRVFFIPSARAETIQTEYSNSEIADAIYLAEGSERAVKPFGILSVPCNGYDDCRQICLNTIRNNKIRFKKQNKYDDFITFLGSRYCPVGCENDNGTNRFWLRNVLYFLEAKK